MKSLRVSLSTLLVLSSLGFALACSRTSDTVAPRADVASETSIAEATPRVDEPRLAPVVFPNPPAWTPVPLLKDRAAPAPAVGAVAAVVIDEGSAAVLFDKGMHEPLAPASLTKIATLILALEQGNLDDTVVSDVDFMQMRGSTVMGLLPDDTFTLRDLAYGMMLPSGNDAALAIGRHIAGSDPAFVDRMNQLVARLGLHDTHFSNPHGLGGLDHNASAFDLGMLARYGYTLPNFREIVTAPVWYAHGSRELSYANINSFLFSYPGADGVKTGYTRRSGPTLVASATRNGHRLYAVVLNAPARDSDASRLLTWAFTNFTWPAS